MSAETIEPKSALSPAGGGARRWERARRGRGGPRRVPWLLALPAVLLLFAFHFVPVTAGAYYSLTNWNGLTAPRWVALSNFDYLFSDPETRDALFHTLEIAAAFVFFSNAIGLGLALALNRTVKSRHFLRAIFFAPAVFSSVAVAYVWQFIFLPDGQGALNDILTSVGLHSWTQPWLGSPTAALWAIVVVLVWQFSGLSMVIYLAGLQAIPDELYEAAAVDGASPLSQLRRITIPLLAPAITVSATITLVFGLRVFDQVIALTDGGPVNATQTLATEIYEQTFVYGRWGVGAAVAVVLTGLIATMVLTQLWFLRLREGRIA
jgi:raffinose/stachyose/melibiose transport system permease protein